MTACEAKDFESPPTEPYARYEKTRTNGFRPIIIVDFGKELDLIETVNKPEMKLKSFGEPFPALE